MSVLINMEMPNNCWECPLMSNLSCSYNNEIISNTQRREDCPIIEVPPHGRLIDADAVERNLVKMQMAQKGVVGHGIRKSRAVVRDMATVIPGDKDGET